jgi:hypothetical protein
VSISAQVSKSRCQPVEFRAGILNAEWTAGRGDKHAASGGWFSPSDVRRESRERLPSLLEKQVSQQRHDLGSYRCWHKHRFRKRMPLDLLPLRGCPWSRSHRQLTRFLPNVDVTPLAVGFGLIFAAVKGAALASGACGRKNNDAEASFLPR